MSFLYLFSFIHLICFYTGNQNVMVIKTPLYFIPKTLKNRHNIYFNDDKSEGRMGSLYEMTYLIKDIDHRYNILEYKYYHFVVDDESSYCLPYIDPGDNWYV